LPFCDFAIILMTQTMTLIALMINSTLSDMKNALKKEKAKSEITAFLSKTEGGEAAYCLFL
jgi:hypothetical protein